MLTALAAVPYSKVLWGQNQFPPPMGGVRRQVCNLRSLGSVPTAGRQREPDIITAAQKSEVENKDDYLREFHRLLNADGLLSFSELAGDPDKMSTQEIRTIAERVGFVFDRLYGSEWNYTINFRKSR
jgi:hypothetical protein